MNHNVGTKKPSASGSGSWGSGSDFGFAGNDSSSYSKLSKSFGMLDSMF